MSLFGSPHGAQAPGRQDAACVLACLRSKPKPPSCTCISETAPSHLKTRSHTPHRRGTGLCAAAHPPAESRQACRPAGTPPACPAQRRGCHPGGRRRNTSGVAGERNGASTPAAQGAQGHLPGLVGPVTLQRLYFHLPKVHPMLSPSAVAALSGGKMPEAPAARWTLQHLRTVQLQRGGTALPCPSLGSMPASGARMPRTPRGRLGWVPGEHSALLPAPLPSDPSGEAAKGGGSLSTAPRSRGAASTAPTLPPSLPTLSHAASDCGGTELGR